MCVSHCVYVYMCVWATVYMCICVYVYMCVSHCLYVFMCICVCEPLCLVPSETKRGSDSPEAEAQSVWATSGLWERNPDPLQEQKELFSVEFLFLHLFVFTSQPRFLSPPSSPPFSQPILPPLFLFRCGWEILTAVQTPTIFFLRFYFFNEMKNLNFKIHQWIIIKILGDFCVSPIWQGVERLQSCSCIFSLLTGKQRHSSHPNEPSSRVVFNSNYWKGILGWHGHIW